MSSGHPVPVTMRVVAATEAVKGVIVFAAGFGALRLLHHDVKQVAVSLVTRLHIDPNGPEAGLFVEVADHLSSARLWLLAGMAVAYAVVHVVDGYGLWFGRPWASWVGVVGGGLYVPVEVYELTRHASVEKCGVLLFNLALLIYLAAPLRSGRSRSMRDEAGERASKGHCSADGAG